MTTHDKDRQPIPEPDRAREAERRRRMAKLRQDSARRTLEVIEQKFPDLKTGN
ncbi:hypothetical protein HMPREF0290_1650 [Corynebacterium efficiens YS-314]|uniref:Uncharacterized protein n=1 Tax=Corynebacterium efficiens (strain DSM 44549 / YS-314 / AJ 12310 / JCM 11189 / NBRC 100395) TaxID=196164 RepID=Q8FTF4_COREF|nr:hypothetical protein [Corynebacterium efficiens]EEW49727.1 hypothetical protein HMPREF0290_1650 [Corynebacterium efficiens YS-314]BAC18425.1 conserved hypothetical protein [Corynebacterium efficiens YS-314]